MGTISIIHRETVDSTNSELKRLLKTAAIQDGSAVLAAHQTRGRGRNDHVWQSRPGNLLTSYWGVFNTPPQIVEGFQLAVSLAIVDWLKTIGIEAKCKWPNDTRVKDRKICGILIEAIMANPDSIKGLIIGVGLNLQSAPVIPDAATQPVCVAELSKICPSPAQACDGIGEFLLKRKKTWLEHGGQPQLQEWLEHCDHLDAPCRFTIGGKKIEGLSRGIGPRGQLLLEIDGKTNEIWADEFETAMNVIN